MIHSLAVSCSDCLALFSFLSQFPHCTCSGILFASYYPVILLRAAGTELKNLLGKSSAVRFSLSAIVRELHDPWK